LCKSRESLSHIKIRHAYDFSLFFSWIINEFLKYPIQHGRECCKTWNVFYELFWWENWTQSLCKSEFSVMIYFVFSCTVLFVIKISFILFILVSYCLHSACRVITLPLNRSICMHRNPALLYKSFLRSCPLLYIAKVKSYKPIKINFLEILNKINSFLIFNFSKE
jgi:hypothetical protein